MRNILLEEAQIKELLEEVVSNWFAAPRGQAKESSLEVVKVTSQYGKAGMKYDAFGGWSQTTV